MSACQEPGDLEDLRDTVKPYDRHVLVCCGDEPWPARIESAEGLLGRIARESKEFRTEDDWPFKVTAVRTPVTGAGYDLLVFPERIAYRDVDADAWDRIRDDHLLAGSDGSVDDVPTGSVEGIHVLVCTHRERDDRCGDCGPQLSKAFRKAAEKRGIEDEVTIHRSSHVGGHRFAGNVIVYPGAAWYGYVRPGDVATILDAHRDGGVWDEHLRGRGLE